jgi:hypothetical protein
MRSERRRSAAILAVALGLATGCTGTTGHLALATTRTVDLRTFDFHTSSTRHVVGRNCTHIVAILPFRNPNFGEALDDALRQAGGTVLANVVVRYEFVDLPFIYGYACYAVEGDV